MQTKKKTENFSDELNAAVLNTLRTALDGILKMEYHKPNSNANANGKAEIDYELTMRMMKGQARIALDLIANIQGDSEK